MKLLRLDLLAFGPFTNLTLDFSGEQTGFHLIYGTNEAGKSTLLRATRGLLFGIPVRSADNFLHEHGDMRIGARLGRSDGSELEVIRRKGQRNTLLDAARTPLDESTIRGWTGGISEDLFARFFGLDHEQLASGGANLVAEQGRASESLFAAGLGGAQLKMLADELESESAALFKPRGDNQSLNKACREYAELKDAAAAQLLACDKYDLREQALGLARKEQSEIRDRLRTATAELNRLQRIQKSHPLVGERRMLQETLRQLETIPSLPANFSRDRGAAIASRDSARTALEQSAAKLENLEAQISGLSLPQALLDNAELVTDLYQRLGGHLKAAQDVPGLRGQLKRLEDDARRTYDQLKPGWPLEQAGAMRISSASSALIQDLGAKLISLREACRKSRLDREQLLKGLADVEAELASLPAPRNIQPLQSAVRLALRDASVDLRQLEANRTSREEEAEASLRRLALWIGAPEEAVLLAMPSQEAVEACSHRFSQWEKRLESLDARMADMANQVAGTDQSLRELRLAFDVPSEQDLAEARQRRDANWLNVKSAWHEKPADALAVPEFAATLENSFEESMEQADILADRLRREAGRVEKLASLSSQKQSREADLAMLKTERDTHLIQREQIETEWHLLWQPVGIEPRSPAEMRAWLQKWDRHAQLAAQLLRERAQLKDAGERLLSHKQRLQQCLETLGELQPPLELPLDAWLDRCQQAIDILGGIETRRQVLAGKVHELKTQSQARNAEAAHAEAALADTARNWTTAMARVGLSGDTTPVEANAILTLMAELLAKLDAASDLRGRIQAIDEDAVRFGAEVERLVQTLAPDLASQPPGSCVAQLHRRLLNAQQDQAKYKLLSAQLANERNVAEKARENIRKSETLLRQLCQAAGCADADGLEPIERKSAAAQAARSRMDEVEKQLLAESGGLTVDEFAVSVIAESPDVLTARIADLNDNIETLESKRSELDKSIGGETALLGMMDGNAKAAALAEDAQAKLAEIHQLASQYVHARLSCGILKREMERYRAENQDPILRRAQEIFSRITLGSFASITTDYDGQDTPVLKGVRPGGGKVPVDGMSDGTRDQLFLALRLASIEKYLIDNEPMPLIVDDILVHFDDPRAKAALAVLGEFSSKTQILFFTHHARLVELAREAIPGHRSHILNRS